MLLLRFDDSSTSRLEIFFIGAALVVILILIFKFLAKGDKDNADEIPEQDGNETENLKPDI